MTESAAVYVIICLAIVGYEALRKRAALYDFLFFFNISFLVYFGLAPLHLIIGGQEYATLPNVHQDLFTGPEAENRLLLMGLLVILSYACTLVGYHAGGRHPGSLPVEYRGTGERGCFQAMGFTLLIGALSLALYVSQFDSITAPFLEAGFLRSGEMEMPGTLAFLQKFVPLLSVGAPLYLAILMTHSRPTKWNVERVALFAGLLVLGSLALLTQGSRRVWMIYAMEFYFLAANWNHRVYAVPLASLGGISLLVLLVGDIASTGLAMGVDIAVSEAADIFSSTWSLLYAAAWRDFTYTFQAMVAIVERYEEFPRLFVDLPLTILQMIPERLVPVKMPEAIESHSTLLIAQVPVPLINEIPPGYIGFFWYSGYLPGVVIGSMAFGWVGRILERFFLPFASRNAVGMLLYTWSAFCWGYWLREGSTYMIAIERMHWLVATIVVVGLGTLAVSARKAGASEAVPAGTTRRFSRE